MCSAPRTAAKVAISPPTYVLARDSGEQMTSSVADDLRVASMAVPYSLPVKSDSSLNVRSRRCGRGRSPGGV